MFSGPRDIPLSRDGSTRYLPWIIGVMIYLAVLAVGAGLMARDVATDWRADLAGVVTVRIPPAVQGEPAKTEERVAAVLAVLKVSAGIAQVRRLPAGETERLLEPWVGREVLKELPLPTLIDLRLIPGSSFDYALISARLSEAAPGSVIEDHANELQEVARLARTLLFLGFAVVAVVAVAGILSVIFTVRTGLAIHREVVEILHLIGARDGYIAGQFQRHVLRLALVGGLVGMLFASVTFIGVFWALSPGAMAANPIALIAGLGFSVIDWALLAGTPVVGVIVAVLAARCSVLRALARMP